MHAKLFYEQTLGVLYHGQADAASLTLAYLNPDMLNGAMSRHVVTV